MRFVLTAFVGALSLVCARPFNEVVTRDVIDPKNTQQNFLNFFDSVRKNDTRQKESYQTILEEEARKERETFDSMKDELRSARSRNVNRQKTLHDGNSRTDKEGSALKREAEKHTHPDPQLAGNAHRCENESFKKEVAPYRLEDEPLSESQEKILRYEGIGLKYLKPLISGLLAPLVPSVVVNFNS